MNATKARTRLLFLAREVRAEAQHWRQDRDAFGSLIHVGVQLAFLARSIERQDTRVVVAAIDMGVGVIVRYAASRAFTEVQDA